MKNIEECLENLVGLQGNNKFIIESSDQNILRSIAIQTSKGVALTDRQYNLVKEKLLKYRDQFSTLVNDFDSVVTEIRMPLRDIDRSKYVSLVSHAQTIAKGDIYESYKEHWKWIKIRFPFSKKTIILIEKIVSKTDRAFYRHNRGSHEHYFLYNEKNLYQIIDALNNKNFDIDEVLLKNYEKILEMKNNKENYLPGIYNFELKNLSSRAIEYMISSVGKPNTDNLTLYKDRQELFGLHHFDQDDLNESMAHLTTLSKKIINRKNTNVFISQDNYTVNNLAESVLELNRFPLLVILPVSDPLSYLHITHTAFSGFVDPASITVMFRLDTKYNDGAGIEFNDYIRKHSLNSPLDSNTKIVYINNDNMPKPLIMSEWNPIAVLMMSSLKPYNRVVTYCDEIDLVIHYDKEPSQFLKKNLDIL